MGHNDHEVDPSTDDLSPIAKQLADYILDHYEDPAHNTPYESAEGGYQYIWGGPFTVDDLLDKHHSVEHPGAVKEVRDFLSRITSVWVPKPGMEDL